ncbi:hypothetical protein, partial [Streptomyces phytophilus]|uniref:hypothetical protein n=1 Tax=Streptomyces phytophilus TaxID=722715 RepID=UPI0015F071FA
MLESGITGVVVGWLCRRAAMLAGRTVSDALSVPEEAQETVDTAVDAVLERLDGDTAWQQAQREAADPEREELPERTRQRLELAVADLVEADTRLADV